MTPQELTVADGILDDRFGTNHLLSAPTKAHAYSGRAAGSKVEKATTSFLSFLSRSARRIVRAINPLAAVEILRAAAERSTREQVKTKEVKAALVALKSRCKERWPLDAF